MLWRKTLFAKRYLRISRRHRPNQGSSFRLAAEDPILRERNARNDPVYVFGTRLRQGRFTAADFELNRLNYPTPLGDFTTRFGGQWTLFDSFANLLNVRRAQKRHEAATQQLERTDQETVFHVIDAYYGLLLSMKQQQLAEQELKTAQSILENSQNRFKSGFVVESDYFLPRSTQLRVNNNSFRRATMWLLPVRD